MKKLFLGTVAVVAALVSPAVAADIGGRAPVTKAPAMMARAASWTGCYLGAGGGYGMYDHETRLKDATTGAFTTVPLDQGGRGWFFTGQVGCDYQLAPNWVIGAFGDGDWSRIRGNHTGQSVGVIGLVSAQMEQSSSWAAGGRIGYLVTPQLLSFFSGGWTEARYDAVNYLNNAGVLTGFGIPKTTFNGWFIGGGVEYAIGLPGLFWKTEYRWGDYSAKDVAVINTTTGVATGVLENIRPHVQTVRSELVYRFSFGGR